MSEMLPIWYFIITVGILIAHFMVALLQGLCGRSRGRLWLRLGLLLAWCPMAGLILHLAINPRYRPWKSPGHISESPGVTVFFALVLAIVVLLSFGLGVVTARRPTE